MTCQLESLPAAGTELSRSEKLFRVMARRRRYVVGVVKKVATDPAILVRKFQRLMGRERTTAPEALTDTIAGEPLGLRPGETVRVKLFEEILATLDERHRCQGCAYMPYVMNKFCGGTYTVRKRIDRFFDEEKRRLLKLRNVVILDGVYCEPEPDGDGPFAGCDRTCFLFWKEAWLERAD